MDRRTDGQTEAFAIFQTLFNKKHGDNNNNKQYKCDEKSHWGKKHLTLFDQARVAEFCFNIPPITRLGHGLVSSDRLEEPGIKLRTRGYKKHLIRF